MKKSILFIITLVIETVLTYLAAEKFSVRFIEVMFFIGLACFALIYWLSSSGGGFTQVVNGQVGAQTGIIQKYESFKFRKSPVLYASLLYLAIGLAFFILLITDVIPAAK